MTNYNCSIASDYAVIHAGKYKFYFGWEYEVANEWAFVAWKDSKEIGRIKGSELGYKGQDCGEILLRGIARFGNTFWK
jgi:hypothetical protein